MKTIASVVIAITLVAACGHGWAPAVDASRPTPRRFGDTAPVTSWLPTQASPLPACAAGQDTCANLDRTAGGCCAAGTYCSGSQGTCPGSCCP